MSKKVLIVDDAAFLRMQLKEMFVKCGAEVVGEAANGAECLEKYPLLKPDLVTMDITMPDMDGITVLKVLKEKYPEAKEYRELQLQMFADFVENADGTAGEKIYQFVKG